MKSLRLITILALFALPAVAEVFDCASQLGCKNLRPDCAERGLTEYAIGGCAENPAGKRSLILSSFDQARKAGVAYNFYAVRWKGACVPLSTPDASLSPTSADWQVIATHMDTIESPCPPRPQADLDPCPEPWTTCPVLPCPGTGVGVAPPAPELERSCLSYALFDRGADPNDPSVNAIGFFGTGWDATGERHLVVVAGSFNYQGADSSRWPDPRSVLAALESCAGPRSLHHSPTWTALLDLEGLYAPVVDCETGDASFEANLERIMRVAQANGATVVCADAELSQLRRQRRSRTAGR